MGVSSDPGPLGLPVCHLDRVPCSHTAELQASLYQGLRLLG